MAGDVLVVRQAPLAELRIACRCPGLRGNRPSVEHQPPEPAFAQDLPDLAQGEERQQRDGHDGPHRQLALPGDAADVRHAVGQGLARHQTESDPLDGMEEHEDEGEQAAL